MAWDQGTAVVSLRSILGDGATDKFIFKQDCIPTADGVTKRFFGGDSRLVTGTLLVNVGVSGYGPSGYTAFTNHDDVAGWFELPTAPSGNVQVQATYYYQWFSDAELIDFVTQALNILGFESAADTALPVGLRPAVLHWAASKAFTFKAAEYADSLSAMAPGGYGIDKKEASPNWARLAQQQFDMGKALLQIYADNPLASKTPQVLFAAFTMRTFVPRS